MAQASNSGRRGAMVFQELGRGIEDFAVTFQTGGLAGGLRAVSNNISQAASLLSPMAGAWTAIGVAIGGLVLPRLLEYVTGLGNAETATERLKRINDEFNESLKRQADIRKSLRGVGQIEGSEEAEQQLIAKQNEITDKEQELAAQINRRARLREQRRTEMGRITVAAPGDIETAFGGGGGMAAAAMQTFIGRLAALSGDKQSLDAIAALGRINADIKGLDDGTVAKLATELRSLQVERDALEKRRQELFEEESQRLQQELTGGMQAVPAAEEFDAMQADRQRKREAAIADAQLEIASTEQQKRQLEKEAEKRGTSPEDKELIRMQLQKLDRLIELQSQQLTELRENALIGVGSE